MAIRRLKVWAAQTLMGSKSRLLRLIMKQSSTQHTSRLIMGGSMAPVTARLARRSKATAGFMFVKSSAVPQCVSVKVKNFQKLMDVTFVWKHHDQLTGQVFSVAPRFKKSESAEYR